MRILIVPGDYGMTNLGDVAMAQVAVTRLEGLWPHARIEVVTQTGDRLEKFCPGTFPVPADGQLRWFGDGSAFGGRLYRSVVPSWVSAPTGNLEAYLRREWPRLAYRMIQLGELSRPKRARVLTVFGEALSNADLVIVSGMGGINSTFEPHALLLLAVLRQAKRLGAGTALLGQGLGPIRTARLRERAGIVLSHTDLITLREKRKGMALLDGIGVDRSRVMITGDDSVELAYDARGRDLGSGIGINLRCAFYSAIDHSLVEIIRPVLHDAATGHSAPLIPVPIRLAGRDSDIPPIRSLLDGYSRATDGWEGIETPAQLIRQIARCRVVVTGSYHAAVFAVAQGIPAVGLARSEYYVDKFLGLSDMFGAGCELIRLDDPGFPVLLRAAIDRAWEAGDGLRPLLLAAAANQVAAGNAAYLRLYELVEAGRQRRRFSTKSPSLRRSGRLLIATRRIASSGGMIGTVGNLRSLIRPPVHMVTRHVMGTLTDVSTSAPLAALTFDDGPHPQYTPKVLELLERYDARGTFFMVGEAARRFPQIVARVAAGGHVVANHSWDHPSFPLISQSERRRQVRACAQVLTPYGRRIFRPPYGHQDLATRFDLLRMGFQVVAWSLHAEDSNERDPDKMASILIDQIRPGSIILLHDALFTVLPDCLPDRSSMVEALERVLSHLSRRFRFVTIPQLLRAGQPHRVNWFGRESRDLMDQAKRSPDDYWLASDVRSEAGQKAPNT